MEAKYKIVKIASEKFRTPAAALDAAGLAPDFPFTGKIFRLGNIIAVVDGEGQVEWNSTMFLLAQALRSASGQGDTVRTYAESLIAWLSFLDGNPVSEVGEVEIQAFRNFMCGGVTGRPLYAANTINLRIRTAMRFHQWGQLKRRFESPLGRHLIQAGSHCTSVSGRSVEWEKRLNVRVGAKLPRILNRDELNALFRRAENPYSLQFKWAVMTGLRRFELCNLRVGDIPKLNGLSIADKRMVTITLRRKGGRDVSIYAPIQLIEETTWYLYKGRPNPVTGAEEFAFLTQSGKAVQKNALTREFARIAKELDIDATLHHLRHTFAIHVLQLLQRRAAGGESINPLKTLQVLMGHSNIQSTEIYLRALDMQNEAVEEALAYLYGDEL